jgi:hypothetical protein
LEKFLAGLSGEKRANQKSRDALEPFTTEQLAMLTGPGRRSAGHRGQWIRRRSIEGQATGSFEYSISYLPKHGEGLPHVLPALGFPVESFVDRCQFFPVSLRIRCRHDGYRSMPPMQTYFLDAVFRAPVNYQIGPMPLSFMPPKGAISVEMMPSLMPTMSYSSFSAARQMWPMSRS